MSDLVIGTAYSVVLHDTESPYWDQVSLNPKVGGPGQLV